MRPPEATVPPASPRLARATRLIAALAALLLLGLGVAAPSTRSVLLFGAVLLLVAAVGGRWLALRYRGLALLVLNALLLLIALEVVAAAVVTLAGLPPVRSRLARMIGPAHDLVGHYRSLSYYSEHSWVERYWSEHREAAHQRYEPYVVWRTPEFAGELIRVDSSGRRAVPGARCEEGAYRVFAFGGSGMWGWGVPDEATIPAYLQLRFAGRHPGPVCVVNLGENAWVSTQGWIALSLALQRGDVPDLVLFYDGVNDILAALQNRRPITHQNLPDIASRFETRQPLWWRWLQRRHVVTVGETVVGWLGGGRGAVGSPASDPVALGRETAAAYLRLVDQASGVAARYGFETHFFWQPHILAGRKPLTPQEAAMLTDLDWLFPITDHARRVFTTTYEAIRTEAETRPHLHYGGSLFDDITEPVWIDTWGHLSPEGNRRVAGWMLEVLEGG